jgi:hypothetical protein
VFPFLSEVIVPLFQEAELPVLVLPTVPELDTEAVPSLALPETLVWAEP